MSDYKMVPTELTDEMIDASGCEGTFYVNPAVQAQRMWADMLAACPDVQVEPVGRVKTVGGYPDESEHTVEWLCKYRDLKDGDLLYTDPQSVEQKPARQYYSLVHGCEAFSPDSDQCICWHNEGEGPLPDGSAKHWRDAPIKPAEQQTEVAALVEARQLSLQNNRQRLRHWSRRWRPLCSTTRRLRRTMGGC